MAKIPEIITNTDRDTELNRTVTLTLEQLYDLMHHTHDIKDIVGSTEYKAAHPDEPETQNGDNKPDDNI